MDDNDRKRNGGSRIGQRVAHYEVIARLGAGGMGEVYRARDSKLGRDVAIKILPDAFLANADRLARFEREARVLASINHPHIAAIYGVEQAHGLRALVLELVEGVTLAERLASDPLSLDEALLVARQIAEALESAHEKGIIHRDLKPANIMFTSSGTVKVLDFGLAKHDAAEMSGSPQSQSPTLTAARTIDGMILGTAAYLSPEQARGRAVDKRADIWAFGCVLYEMLTGRAVFAKETVPDTIAAILGQEPDWNALPDTAPPAIRGLLHRCLAKDPRRRLHDIADARIDIDDMLTNLVATTREASSPGTSTSHARARRQSLPWWLLAATVLALIGVSALALTSRRSPDVPRPVRFSLTLPGSVTFSPTSNFFSMSPDGRQIAFVANSAAGLPVVWVRALETLEAQPLKGTEGARQPFWSPDSRFIGFFTPGGFIKKVAVTGGPVQTLSINAVATGTGATWSREGVILFSSLIGPVQRISASGGAQPVAVTVRNEAHQEIAHSFPCFLPDGKRFLYYVRSIAPEHNGIYVKAVDSDEQRLVLRASSNVSYVPPGFLLYVRDRVLMAQPFDANETVTTGEPFAIAERIDSFPESGIAAFSASDTGALVYRSSSDGAVSHLVWFDRRGNKLGELGDPASYRNPRVSPDGKRLAVELVDASGNRDIWITDLARGVPVRFTFDPGRDAAPVWSADGLKIAWQGNAGLYIRSSTGAGKEERLRDEPWIPDDWLHDGSTLLCHPNAPRQVWRMPLEGGDRTPRPAIEGRAITTQARVSPDGRWVAFANSDTARFEIYLQDFPAASGRWQVSTTGGIQPKWRRDGKELFYLALDGRLMAVPVTLGALAEVGKPQPLFQTRVEAITGFTWHQYDVSSDGQRLLVNTPDSTSVPVTVVLDWPALAGRGR